MTDYRGYHTAPIREEGNTLDDFSMIWPEDDFRDPRKGAQYYGHGGSERELDVESARIISQFLGKPDSVVKVYRSVPIDADNKIHTGDWVSISQKYATKHGERHVEGNFKVLCATVKANEIATDGNSIHEWGFSPIQERTLECKVIGKVHSVKNDVSFDI